MFFSIIIPLFNRPEEIKELLNSLLDQEYKKFEVLVIEDGSSRDAKSVVEQYQPLLDLHYYVKENSGQGFARNYAFERAKGDYFIIFDSDCLIPSSYLTEVLKGIEEQKLDAYGGPDAAHESFTAVQKAISYAMTSPFTTGGIRGNKKHVGTFHPRSFNMGLSRRVWEKIGGFNLTRLGEDIEYSIRIYEAGFKVGLLPGAFVYHKRRTDFFQFYKQLHFFGRARINIYLHFPRELKLVHFLPAAFVIFLGTLFLLNILHAKFSGFFNWVLLTYTVLLFIHARIITGSFLIAAYSVLAAYIQLVAYGLGFIQDFFKRVVIMKFSKKKAVVK